jgi:hypothetical protein
VESFAKNSMIKQQVSLVSQVLKNPKSNNVWAMDYSSISS